MNDDPVLKEIADNALKGSNSIHVVIGPLSWLPSDGTASKQWYFLVCSSEAERGFRCDRIIVPSEDEACRMAVIAEFLRRKPIVLHNMDDELDMIRLCETLWPGERVTTLREATERERAPTR